jgi:DNA-binding phage protein
MIQADIQPSTRMAPASAGNVDQNSSRGAAVRPATAVILLRAALGDVERRAQNIASVLWLMAHSAKVDDIASEAMLSIEDMVRELRDIATGAQQVEVIQ